MTWHLLQLLLGNRVLINVVGDSMSPTYKDGETLIMNPKAYKRRLPLENEIVVFNHPYIENMILLKRVSWVKENQLYLVGDKKSSTDSRSFGTVPLHKLRGKVIGRYSSNAFLDRLVNI